MRKIDINAKNIKGKLDKFYLGCIGAGRAGEVMRHVPSKQLDMLLRDIPFGYIRFHGLFHEEMGVVKRSESGKLEFFFGYVDMLFDMLIEKNIRPIVELGLMPDCMAKEKEYVFWWKMNKSMPRDVGEWRELIFALVRHITERYGEDEVKKWYFEVWNEPNHPSFFTEYKNINAYFALYDAAAFAIKEVCKDYRVGGPATAGMVWINEFIAHCAENNVPVDFVSSHSYGIKGDFDPDGKAIVYLPNAEKVSNEIRIYGDICHKNELEFIVTEWSSSFSSTDFIHDSYFNAAYIIHNIKRSEGYADMMSYWTYTDIFEENGIPTRPFHGGFGLININSIPKASYYAYKFLASLYEDELFCDDECCYATSSNGSVRLLIWNIKKPDGDRTDDRAYFGSNPAQKKIDRVTLKISGFDGAHAYTVSVKSIGHGKCDAYTEYLSRGANDDLSREETAEIIEATKPIENSFSMLSDENGTLVFSLDQWENGVDFIEIRKT